MRSTATIPFLLVFAGCSVYGGEEQSGTLECSELALPDCELDRPFVLEMDFVAFSACENLLVLRVQDGGKSIGVSDGVEMQVDNVDAVVKKLESGEVTLAVPEDGARIALYLNSSCPESFTPVEARNGTITFHEMELEQGGTLRLSAKFDIHDGREETVLGTGATLDVEAEISTRPPHTSFMECP